MPHSNAQFTTPASVNLDERCDCLVVGVQAARNRNGKISTTMPLPAALIKQITSALDCGDIGLEIGAHSVIHRPTDIGAERLLIVNLGQPDKSGLRSRDYATVCSALAVAMARLTLKKAVVTVHLHKVCDRDLDWCVHQLVRQVLYARYQFSDFRSTKVPRPVALSVALPCSGAGGGSARKNKLKRAIDNARAIAAGESACRDLGNTPPNVCTPEYLARKARALGKTHKSVKVEVLDEKRIEREGMQALLAVARGSRNKPRLIVLDYKPAKATARKNEQPLVLVGKGISFDTGGISLKPAMAMDEMKFDMCGAASVYGTMQAVAEMKLDRHVIGVMVCAENMPDGDATRPGDVVTTRSGQSVEILNTDAEGRLVLCDALDYVKRYKPGVVIDIATLTGACVVALGKVASGLLSNDDRLVQELVQASNTAMDFVWNLPLWEEYSEQLKSPVADMANIGGRDADTITAACFLWKFCKEFRWAHLDIAGTAWLSAPQRTATGRPVPLLCQYLIDNS